MSPIIITVMIMIWITTMITCIHPEYAVFIVIIHVTWATIVLITRILITTTIIRCISEIVFTLLTVFTILTFLGDITAGEIQG